MCLPDWPMQEAHFNHGKSLEKVVYPYRNASQIELGKDPLNYSQTSQAEYATDRFKVGGCTSCIK